MCYGVVLICYGVVDHRYTECGGYKGITKQLENEYSGRID